MSAISIVYRGYRMTRFTDHGPWFVYENLVEVMEGVHPSELGIPVVIDAYLQLDLAKQFVRSHQRRVAP